MSRAPIDVAKRLKITADALKLTGAQIARETSITANEWTQFLNPEKYKRRITVSDVLELKDNYGFTLEWVFDADLLSLREPLRSKVRAKMRKAAA